MANQPSCRDCRRLRFVWPEEVPRPTAGQFVTIRATDDPTPMLRRPLPVARFDESGIATVILDTRNEGIRQLVDRKPNHTISVMGPMGTGFPRPSAGATPVLAASGSGIGPVLYLAQQLAGSRSGPLLLAADDDAHLMEDEVYPGINVRSVTACGGNRTEVALKLLEETVAGRSGPVELFLSGDAAFLKAGAFFAREQSLPAWVSMEHKLGCAVGACMGCAIRVNTPARLARVCTEGPVFRSTEIVWE